MVKLTLLSAVLMGALATSQSHTITLAECRSLPSVQERQDCYVRRAESELSTKQESGAASNRAGSTEPGLLDALRRENDQVSAKLMGICRGCYRKRSAREIRFLQPLRATSVAAVG